MGYRELSDHSDIKLDGAERIAQLDGRFKKIDAFIHRSNDED